MLKLNFHHSQEFKLDQDPKLAELAQVAKSSFLQDKPGLGFAQLPYQDEEMNVFLYEAEKYAEEMDAFVVIGVGGPDLGTRAIVDALLSKYQRRIYFCGDTTDPKTLLDLGAELNLKRTLFLVVSKSGNTIEQGISFLYFREQISNLLGESAIYSRFLFLTDPKSGNLRKLVNEQGYSALPIPENVGGRFAVLSTVGMIPAHYAGLNVADILRGARDLAENIDQTETAEDIALRYTAWQYAEAKSGKNITVVMPYQYGLNEFARWFKQLWAESLGKKMSKTGETVHVGTTPVNAIGPTDQHSQLQLFNEGPDDKIFTFITARAAREDISLPTELSGLDDFAFLAGKSMQEVLNQEYSTTAFALRKNGRKLCTLEIDQLDEYHLGQLFYFFELVVVYLGYMYNIDPYDQPGVELSKNAMFGLLGKSGYEEYKEEFDRD